MTNSTPLVILCTGANRGIGFAIVQALASHPKTANASFLLGCRSADKGKEAIDELRGKGIKSSIEPLVLDVNSNASIQDALGLVQRLYGRLDVLINNAGYAAIPSSSEYSDWRDIYARVYETNVTSVALMMQTFLPLLRKSTGTIINISSARGSAGLASSGALPPTVSVPYSVSKAALNMLTIEMSRQAENQKVEFQLVSPGHCKTAFNGYRGTRDPLEGANVIVGLIVAEEGRYKNSGFWETKGANLDLVEIPW